MQLKPARIGLFDQYGGLITSGWDRWLFEQYEFPFKLVYPKMLDQGDLKERFDVLLLTDGAFEYPRSPHTGGYFDRQPLPADIPEEFRDQLGRITIDKTVPQLKRFVEAGGTLITVGSSSTMGEVLGLPVENYLTDMGSDGIWHPLSRDKYYIPGSLLKAQIDNTSPLAYGMPQTVNFFFDNSPVFKLRPDAAQKQTTAVAWFASSTPLVSGWAWGQQYLNGGTAVAEARIGRGRVFLMGPEVTFRAQPHATFKLLFNAIHYGAAEPVILNAAQ